MASVVCQGLQSCLEPRLIEPLVLRHKLAPPKTTPSYSSQQMSNPSQKLKQEENSLDSSDEEEDNKKKNGDNSGWSFLKALTNPSSQGNNHKENKEEVYVHPMVKRSASALSTKSLEMCTESLGSETGSEISESSDELPSLSWVERERLRAIRGRAFMSRKVPNRSGSFPPPLTTISGSDGVRVKPHREGGRLVIKAVTVSSCSTYFKAERSNGRLTLSLLKDCSVNCDGGLAKMEEIEVSNEEEHGEEKVVHENVDVDDDDGELYDGNDGDDDEEEDDDDDDDEGEWSWDMEGNRGKVGCEMGRGDLTRPTRCKESGNGNKGISNWGSFWVAIS